MTAFESVAPWQRHHYIGAIPISKTATRFCVWAPNHELVMVHFPKLGRSESMQPSKDGYHAVEVEGVGTGDRYFYRLGGNTDRPDPASRYQPLGVHGPSEIVDRDFDWSDQPWCGVRSGDLVIYELHIGALTQPGSFESAIDRLDELVDLGITAIELMPIAEAAGRWNWGYDGVCLFAPNHNYGHPDELRQLVDAAHRSGLAVILDVVYNHLGPEGNYLAEFGPYFSNKHSTPWGDAPNFDCPDFGRPVRDLVVANAIYWLDEFHIDALRVDAVHCTKDESNPHVIAEISSAAKAWSAANGRTATLIAESNVYDPEFLSPLAEGGMGFDGQWCDDFLHSLFAVVRPEEQLCHRSYEPGTDLERTLRSGFVFQGTIRSEPRRMEAVERVRTDRLIYSIQNHDFVGNHPRGQRFHKLTSIEAQKSAAALLILAPAIPMLFMGEEFACETPFPFFVDFGDHHLREAVVQGRKREYPQHDWSSGLLPTDERTFLNAKIGSRDDGDRELWHWYQSLIQVRRDWIALGLLCDEHLTVETDIVRGLYCLRYQSATTIASVAVRLVAEPSAVTPIAHSMPGETLLDSRGESSSGLLPNHAVITCRQASEPTSPD